MKVSKLNKNKHLKSQFKLLSNQMRILLLKRQDSQKESWSMRNKKNVNQAQSYLLKDMLQILLNKKKFKKLKVKKIKKMKYIAVVMIQKIRGQVKIQKQGKPQWG